VQIRVYQSFLTISQLHGVMLPSLRQLPPKALQTPPDQPSKTAGCRRSCPTSTSSPKKATALFPCRRPDTSCFALAVASLFWKAAHQSSRAVWSRLCTLVAAGGRAVRATSSPWLRRRSEKPRSLFPPIAPGHVESCEPRAPLRKDRRSQVCALRPVALAIHCGEPEGRHGPARGAGLLRLVQTSERDLHDFAHEPEVYGHLSQVLSPRDKTLVFNQKGSQCFLAWVSVAVPIRAARCD
jgi:hypothetical protein